MSIVATKSRIKIAIDYGTTYTGLAWWQTNGSDDKKKPSLNEMKLYQNWPLKDGDKVPSKLSYDMPDDGVSNQWGYSLSIGEKSKVLQWTKLELDLRTTVAELRELVELMKGHELIRRLYSGKNRPVPEEAPEHIYKNSEDIVRDYMERVIKAWWKFMTTKPHGSPLVFQNIPIDLIITHPAGWLYEPRNKIVRSIKSAFTIGRFPLLGNVYITPEPEAAASSIVQDLVEHDISETVLTPGYCFIVLDAGGGTVDAAAYYIERTKPLVIRTIGEATSARCGATFIDRGFLKWLDQQIYGVKLFPDSKTSGGHFSTTHDAQMLLERFEQWKHGFSGTKDDPEAIISLPGAAKLVDKEAEERGSGTITVPGDDMRQIFKQSVEGTKELLRKQVTRVKVKSRSGKDYRVENIFLTGGFAASPYLFNQVRAWANGLQIDVQRVKENRQVAKSYSILVSLTKKSWSGVVRGALIQGIGLGVGGIKQVAFCPRHYGLRVTQTYDFRNINQKATVSKFNGAVEVSKQAAWMIRKGDVIIPGEPIVQEKVVTFRLETDDWKKLSEIRPVFVASASDVAPTTLAKDQHDLETKSLCVKLAAPDCKVLQRRDLKDPKLLGRYFWILDVKIRITVSDSVRVEALIDDLVQSTEEIKNEPDERRMKVVDSMVLSL